MRERYENRVLELPLIVQEAIKWDKKYSKIPIEECGEKLVNIKDYFSCLDTKVVFNEESTSTGQERLFLLRQELIEPLNLVARELNDLGYKLRFEYVYRRFEDQKDMYKQSVEKAIKNNPLSSREKILEIAGIAIASTPDTAAHVSGAAVDVTLLRIDGQIASLGAEYLDDLPKSATNCPDINKEAKMNRRRLVQTMEMFGFVNYPFEFWHFCMGDKIEAFINHKNYAIYGPLNLVNKNTLETSPVENASIPFNVDDLFVKK